MTTTHYIPKRIKEPASLFITNALLLSTLSVSTAFGQSATDAEPERVSELDAFVVSGQFLYSDQVNALKTPTPIIDVPQSLSITTSDQIKEQGFDSIGDIVNYTPGVNNAQGEGHRDAVVFRGSRSTGAFFVDGVRDDVEHYRPLYNVEQLEILRGPNALLFGRGGTGGVINRVMKKGIIGDSFNEYQISIDTFGAHSAQIDSNFGLNENSAFRINAFYEGLENHRDYYDGTRFGVSPTMKFQLSETTSIDLTYEYSNNERFIDRGIPTGADNKPEESLNDVFFGDKDQNETTFEAHVIRAALQHRISDELKGRLDFAYGDYDKYYNNWYASGYNPAASEVTLSGYDDSTERQNLTVSGGLVAEFETANLGHTLLTGFEFVGSQNDNDRMKYTGGATDNIPLADLSTFLFPAYNELNDKTEAELNVLSFYIQNEIAFSEHFDLVLGARFDRFDFEVDDLKNNNSASQLDEELTPRLGFVFKPQENLSFYTSYSQTFLPTSGEQYASVALDEANLDPSEFINLEAGFKWDITPSSSITAAIFELEQDGLEASGITYKSVASEVRGFEAQYLGQVNDAWFVSAGYSYLDGEVTGTDNNGKRPRELPEHSFSLWNRYQLTEQLGFGLGAIYQGKTYITSDNDTELPAFVRFDAAAYYALSDNLSLQLNIENLLNEDYYPHAHGDHQVTVGESINATLSLTGRF